MGCLGGPMAWVVALSDGGGKKVGELGGATRPQPTGPEGTLGKLSIFA